MGYNVEIKLNDQGVRDVLNASGIANFDRKLAEGVKNRAISLALSQNEERIKRNPLLTLKILNGYEIKEEKTGQRTRYKVIAINGVTKRDNREHNTLLRALHQ